MMHHLKIAHSSLRGCYFSAPQRYFSAVLCAAALMLYSHCPVYAQNTWVATNAGITDFSVFSLTPHNGFMIAGTTSGCFRSADDGATWTTINTGLTNLTLFSLLSKGGYLFCGTVGGGVHRSSDDGTTWATANTGLTNLTVYALATNGADIFAGTVGGGVFRSSDDGATWTAVNTGLTNLSVFSLLVRGGDIFAATNGGGVFRSSDNGATWAAVNTGITNLGASTLESAGPNILVGTFGGGAFLSSDNGATWSAVGGVPVDIWRIYNASGTLYAGTGGTGIVRSSDNGATWSAVNTGLTNSSVWSLTSSPSGEVYAGTLGGGVHKLLDPPTITVVGPPSGTTGDVITIVGTNFFLVSAVAFGGTPAASFTVVSNNIITAVLGAGATGNVTVTTPLGTASYGTFTFGIIGMPSGPPQGPVFVTPPIITDFFPKIGSEDTVVTIVGKDFFNVTGVVVGGFGVKDFTVLSSTLMRIVIGRGSTGVITIFNTSPTGLNTSFGVSEEIFTYVAPPPSIITGIEPTSGKFGTNVTIRGKFFLGTSAVLIGNFPVQSYSVLSDSVITAVVGNGRAGKARVGVITQRNYATFDWFDYLATPPPVITLLDPASIQAGGEDFDVTILGDGFAERGAVVTLDTRTGGTIRSASNSRLVVRFPAFMRLAGAKLLTVTNPDGQSTSATFRVTPAPPPQFTSFVPSVTTATGKAFTLGLRGTGFFRNALVTIDRVPYPSVVSSSTSAAVTVLGNVTARSTTITVSLLNPDGQSTSATFVILPPPAPTITNLSAKSWEKDTLSMLMVVDGNNFAAPTIVALSSVELQVVSHAVNRIVAVVPPMLRRPRGRTGDVPAVVMVINPDKQYDARRWYVENPPPLTITHVLPVVVLSNGNGRFGLPIQGIGFLPNPVTLINGYTTRLVEQSDSTLLVEVPPAINPTNAVGTQQLVITNPNGERAEALFQFKRTNVSAIASATTSGPASAINSLASSDEAPNTLTVLTVYPNPARTLITVRATTPFLGNVAVNVVNSAGNTVRTITAVTDDGCVQTELPVDALNAGLYTLELLQNGKRIQRSFVVVR